MSPAISRLSSSSRSMRSTRAVRWFAATASPVSPGVKILACIAAAGEGVRGALVPRASSARQREGPPPSGEVRLRETFLVMMGEIGQLEQRLTGTKLRLASVAGSAR
jgi:hypothetical protein